MPVTCALLVLLAAVGVIDVGWYHLHRLRLYRDPLARKEQIAHSCRGALFVAMLVLALPYTPRGRWVDVGLAVFVADFINTIVDTLLERKSRPRGLDHGEYVVHVAGSVLAGGSGAAFAFETWSWRSAPTELVARSFPLPLFVACWVGIALVAGIVLIETTLHILFRSQPGTRPPTPPQVRRQDVPPEIGKVELDPAKMAWLYGNLVAGLCALPFGLSLVAMAGGALLAFLTLCVGHSVGLHRGVIHRTYRCSRAVRCILAGLFALAGLGGPISWMRVHFTRDHWQGRTDCPPYFRYGHGLATDWHWNLHCRFVPKNGPVHGIPDDDARDPFLLLLEKVWFLPPILLALAIACVFGPAVAGVTCCLRVAAGILGHWFVGFVSHTAGYVRYGVADASSEGRNVLVLGVLSFGEGFHNNHHAHPGSARMGMKWYELDAGWLVIRCLEVAGLVTDVQAWHRDVSTRKPAARAVEPRFVFHAGSTGAASESPDGDRAPLS